VFLDDPQQQVQPIGDLAELDRKIDVIGVEGAERRGGERPR
jgi:hypothetical protein